MRDSSLDVYLDDLFGLDEPQSRTLDDGFGILGQQDVSDLFFMIDVFAMMMSILLM